MDVKSNFSKGMNAYNDNNYEEAIKHLNKSSELLKDVNSFFYLAQCYSHARRHEEAVDAYKKAYEVIEKEDSKQTHVTILMSKAKEQQILGWFNAAKITYDEVMRVAKKYMKEDDLHILDSDISSKKDKLDELWMKEGKMNINNLFDQAQELERQGLYNSAIELYKKSFLVKETAEGHFRSAECYRVQKKYTEAIESYSRCVQLRKDYIPYGDTLATRALLQKGICYLELSKLKEADESFTESYKVLPYGNMLKETIKEYSGITNERSKVLMTH